MKKQLWMIGILSFLLMHSGCASGTQTQEDQDVFKSVFGKTFDQTTDEIWYKLTGQSKTASAPDPDPAPVKIQNTDLSQNPYFGISPFPYDATLEAIEKTLTLTRENSTLFAAQLDHGIPWKEAYEKKPWPQKFQSDDWENQIKNMPDHKTKPRYISVAPLKDDRITLAGPGAGSSYPARFDQLPLNDARIKQAYLYYIRRVIQDFQPDILNLGQEAGDIAHHAPAKWPAFAELYEYVRSAVKKDYPQIQIGISFSLPFLMKPETAARVKPLVEKSDYLGISFYPYMTAFYEKMRGAGVGEGPDSWRKPFSWLRSYTSKPIAFCETAYASAPLSLSQYQLHLGGNAELQKQYVEELFQTARQDQYLFAVWFAVVDYDRLYEKLFKDNQAGTMWMRSGFFDPDLKPKPAWAVWTENVKKSA